MKILVVSLSIGAMMAELIQDLLINKFQFIAILAVVIVDSFFGIAKALYQDNFETRKAFKAIFMLVAFWVLLATVLLIEKGFPFASFLSEAILLPILVFQLISILKNMQLLGLINNTLANEILKRIDNHKG
jgi:phage-related holin